MPETTTYGTVRAPAFPPGLTWLNTAHPLRLQDLRGKFVLLDFWTYCCINCMHILPDLERLEEKYRDELVVIGVHSAKFPNERGTESIRNAILRYGIKHPVVNDHRFEVWQQYAARAWPTLYLVDPRGYIVGKMAGEGVFEPFDEALQRLIPEFERDGLLRREPLVPRLERDEEPEAMLAYPGKIHAHEASQRLFIADTNHHRLLVTDFDGRVEHTIGSGEAGLLDGSFEEAQFRQPQGLFYDDETDVLYVADTENHALRRIAFHEQRVETLAGTGAQARFGAREADGARSPLNSPWDLLLHGDDGGRRLYVAMAGSHQVWSFSPETGRGEVYAGTGSENIVDAPRLEALLAQPSGLASDGTYLYVADSETSALRRIAFGGPDSQVETLVGEGLFEYGDVDGRKPEARLQHPLGIAYYDGVIYLADSYNHKIRRYFLDGGALVSLSGTGQAGHHGGGPNAAQFNEPGGLATADGRLFVADTNNHRIRTVDLETGDVRTLSIAEMTGDDPFGKVQTLPLQTVQPGAGRLVIEIALPPGYKPNHFNTGTLTLTSQDVRPADASQAVAYPTVFPVDFAEGETSLDVEGAIYYCDETSGRCLIDPIRLRVPVRAEPSAASPDVHLTLAVSPPEEQ
ncbi:MAG: thioredoxin-like domain-containing protein [Rhodothermales bacterium]